MVRAWLPTACAATMMVAAAQPTAGQTTVSVSTSVHGEGYSFDSTFGFSRVWQLSVPVGVDLNFGQFGNLTVSGGYANTYLDGGDVSEDQQVAGAIDTQLRLGINLLQGRVIALVEGALPTGAHDIATTNLAAAGIIANDLIGFTTNSFGTGGGLGGGIVGAVPAGRLALGFGATYLQPFTYEPILADTGQVTLRVGGELRLRAGMEGPLGQRSYFRVAGVFAVRQNDEVNGATVNGVGNRITGYVTFNQGLGASSSVTVYGFDIYRGTPSIEGSALGATILPKGNLLSLGARMSVSPASKTTVTPALEYRLSHAASREPADPSDPLTVGSGNLAKVGSSVRAGLGLGFVFSQTTALIVDGSGLFGSVKTTPGGDFSGFRVAVHLSVTP